MHFSTREDVVEQLLFWRRQFIAQSDQMDPEGIELARRMLDYLLDEYRACGEIRVVLHFEGQELMVGL